MDELELEDKFATAEKWARLYGGAIAVMLVDDGRGLEEPLDWENARSIDEIRVFERSIVQPDYTALYRFNFLDTLNSPVPFGEPEYYTVFSIYGSFIVHRSRCLVFRNGRLPEQTTNALYRYWGIPEYVKIKHELRECRTSHRGKAPGAVRAGNLQNEEPCKSPGYSGRGGYGSAAAPGY